MNIIFMGRKSYAAEMLEWTVGQGICVKAVCTDSQYANSPTMLRAQHLGIPVISMEESEQYVEEHPGEIDLIVSYLYWRKIRKPLIEGPRYGCINFHPAILPDWRGCGGYNIAILNKLQEWGATAHYIDEKIDMGSVIRVFKFSFDYRMETAYSLEKKTQRLQMDLYKSVIIDVMEKGRLECTAQQKESGIYISKKQMLKMMEIDLNNLEDEDLDTKIRAFWFPPYSGAGFKYNDKFYTIINDDILKTLQDGNSTALVNKETNQCGGVKRYHRQLAYIYAECRAA
jgi:methionyl-tRNA formyltransferase